jgi:hypothetical protein
MTIFNEAIAQRLLQQAEWCETLGSPLYSTLLRETAADVRVGGPCFAVLHDHHQDPPDSALALRFLGAVHRIVLQGKAPQLAACYPSAGGGNCDRVWPAFQNVVQHHAVLLRDLVRRPVQTNEVGRCAPLLGGFLEIARRTSLPLRLLEVGAAGGLILRWDKYRYAAGDLAWGDPDSPLRIDAEFGDTRPPLDVSTGVIERLGCDALPVDVRTEEGRLTLQSYIWPDQVDRFRQLSAAIEVAHRVPAKIDQADAADWVESVLADRISEVATVVYHSIVWQYLSEENRARIKNAIRLAGEAATHRSPLAWLRFEPGNNIAEVRLQIWPGGEDELLARSGFHGKPIEWLGRLS